MGRMCFCYFPFFVMTLFFPFSRFLGGDMLLFFPSSLSLSSVVLLKFRPGAPLFFFSGRCGRERRISQYMILDDTVVPFFSSFYKLKIT